MCRTMLALSRLDIIPGSKVVMSALSPTTMVSSDRDEQPVTTSMAPRRPTAAYRVAGVRRFIGRSS